MEDRRIYKIDRITINGIKVAQVIIDPHFEAKHADHITDRLILRLVKELDGRTELPDTKDGAYSYFVTAVELDSKQYRLIWLLEDNAIYVGVINAFRERRRRR